jgi:hypothetical protein
MARPACARFALPPPGLKAREGRTEVGLAGIGVFVKARGIVVRPRTPFV